MWKNFEFGTRLFEDMDREFAEKEELLDQMFRTARVITPSETEGTFPYYYGYQITVGPDGKPHVKEFSNIRPAARGLVEQTGIREPLVESKLNKDDNSLIITAEMPGVTKQDVKVKITEGYVSIHAEKGEKKYHTDIPVSETLDDKSAKATYSNGILELKIKVKVPPKRKETEVQVE